jgi:hypothetical protein
LRSNKKLLHELQNKKERPILPALPKSLPPTPLLRGLDPDNEPKLYPLIDSWAALLSRQFDRDRESVLRRTRDADVRAVVIFTSDIEKQHDIMEMAQQEAGFLYCCVGVHPDNGELLLPFLRFM